MLDAKKSKRLPKLEAYIENRSEPEVSTVATGLDNPRHLTFDSDGNLYVAEAGKGGNGPVVVASELGNEYRYGLSGAITRIEIENGAQERILEDLPSIALEDGSRAFGPQGIDFDDEENLYYTVGYSSDFEKREEKFDVLDSSLGRLYKFNLETNSTEKLADFVEFESFNNSDGGDDFISNPYDLKIYEDKILAVDAGANVLLEVDSTTGTEISLEAILGPTNVDGIASQSVPSAIEVGPDGAYYVSEFTGVPYPEGGAAIYRIEPGKRPDIYAEGFSNITDIAFNSRGELFVLEYDDNSVSIEGDSGRLTMLTSEGDSKILLDDLQNPAGLIVGSDDAIYLSNNGNIPGEGEILRIEDYHINEPISFGSEDTNFWREKCFFEDIAHSSIFDFYDVWSLIESSTIE